MNALRPVRPAISILVVLLLSGCCCIPTGGGGNTETIGSTMKCDYSQVGQTGASRKFAWTSDQRLSPRCLMLRNDPMHLARAPNEAHDFGSVCNVKFEIVGHPNQSSACQSINRFTTNDRFELRPWNSGLPDSTMMLTIRRGANVQFDVALKEVRIPRIAGVPWLHGDYDYGPGVFKFFVFLEQRPNDRGIDKFYRIEMFDTEDPNWTRCQLEMPSAQTVTEVDCDGPPPGDGNAQQSDTGGGGEPPMKQR